MDEMHDMLAIMIAASREAGAAALALREAGLRTEKKSDESPVTAADREAERIILRVLDEAFPGVPVVAEEAFCAGRVPEELGNRFFLVDPIDGTREFVAGRDEFTVNVALVAGAHLLAGIVYAPALDELHVGSPAGAFRERAGRRTPIRVGRGEAGLRALASRSHRTAQTNAFLARHAIEDVRPLGSSLKFCRVAEGAADLYPCLGRTMEWDTAAGQAVLEAAGGQVLDMDGTRLTYGKRAVAGQTGPADFANPFFLALGAISLPTS